MRLPAVAIAAAFAGGIALGLHPVVARNASSYTLLSYFFMATAIVILTGILLARVGQLFLQLSLPCSAGNGQRLEISCFIASPSAANAAVSVQAKTPDHKQD